MNTIDIKYLAPNESPLTHADLESCKSDPRIWPATPYPIDEQLNNKVILYDGDLELLRAEALVNPTNEDLTHFGIASKLAGPELESYTKRKIRVCPTGDVRVSPGFRSNFKYIIHAVPPKYQLKYKTAAETALFHTYFSILEAMIERKIRTVVIPTLTTPKCNPPIEDNCRLQLRVIRRFLEKKSKEFDKIVIKVQSAEDYKLPFFCYFPKSSVDESVACYRLEPLLGGPNGEPVIPGREIRIKSKPSIGDSGDHSIDLSSGLDLSTVVGKTEFSKMRDEIEKQAERKKTFMEQLANRINSLFVSPRSP